MSKRMIVAVALLLGACQNPSHHSGSSGETPRLRKVETGVTTVTRQPAGHSRTVHFAESARGMHDQPRPPVRRHPALGPHSPDQLKRRAQLIEGPTLATPPAATRSAESGGRAFAPSRIRVIRGADGSQGLVMEREEVVAEVDTPGEEIEIENGRIIGRRPGNAGERTSRPVSSRDDQRRRAEAEDADAAMVEQGAFTQPAGPCIEEALAHLRRYSPSGYAVYEKIADKRMFTTWILCDEMQRGLTTAVHETVHMLTDQLDAYPLIEGGQLKRLRNLERFPEPGRIASQFPNHDDYVRTYLLPGAASSAQSFTYLLDEFNAYTHDLHTAIQTFPLAPKGVNNGHRDGMASMMAFLMTYIAYVEQNDREAWAGLQRPEVQRIVTTLWAQAERTIERSCQLPRYAVDDQAYLNHICEPANGTALGRLLGRAPRCPRACLSPSG